MSIELTAGRRSVIWPLSAIVFSDIVGGGERSKMALRMMCTVALQSGRDLGVNNVRQFVTTGMITFSCQLITYRCRLKVFKSPWYAKVSSGIIWQIDNALKARQTKPNVIMEISTKLERNIM